MLKSFASAFVVLILAVNASAAFSIMIEQTSGPAFATVGPTSATSGSGSLIGPGFPFLNYNYNIVNTAPSLGYFNLNDLSFTYAGIATPVGIRVTIIENNANFFGTGTELLGQVGFSAFGNTLSTYSNQTTFTPSNGGDNVVNLGPSQYPGMLTPIGPDVGIFTSGGATGTITSIFDFSITPNSFAGLNSVGGTGNIGVTGNVVVPAPPALLFGLFAVPTLAMLRRRFSK